MTLWTAMLDEALAEGLKWGGEMSLMTGAPRAATVVAVTDVECYRLDKSVFQTVLRRRPELAEHVASTLAERRVRLAEVTRDLDEAAHVKTVAVAKGDLLDRIRDFFGLTHDDHEPPG